MPRLIEVRWVHVILLIFFSCSTWKKKVLFLLFRLNVPFNNLSDISRLLFGCVRELNVHRTYMTWHSTQSHYTDTGPTSSAFSMPGANERAANTILKSLEWLGRGSNPQPQVRTQAGRSSNWATAPVGSKVNRPDDLNGFHHNWASAWQNQQNDWAPREESDQHGYPHSLISLRCALNGLLSS